MKNKSKREMGSKIFRTGIVAVLTYIFYVLVKAVELYSNTDMEEILIASARTVDLWIEKEKEIDETGNRQAVVEKAEDGYGDTENKPPELEKYYGLYQVVEFRPTIYYGVWRFDALPEQEADMIVGRTIRIEEDLFRTYDSERWKRGPTYFPGNYRIKEFVIEDPLYVWTDSRTELDREISDIRDGQSISIQECNRINGMISIQDGVQVFYTMEGGNRLILYSKLTFQYFVLEKTDEVTAEKEAAVLTREEKEEVLDIFQGEYKITEFLPTRYYPAQDPDGIDYLPQEEADMMLGKTILVSRDKCILYDNGRQPNSISMERGETEYLLNEIIINQPDYQVDSVIKDDIFGLRDEILPEEMERDEYIQVSVYPGYESGGYWALPQFYLLGDGKAAMYSMGEYFLLEKVAED